MTACRYDRDLEQHLTPDGEPCTHDEYGDPTKHCTARTNCGQHIGPNDLTCARCIGRTRSDIKRIADLAALMLPAAIAGGVNSEAANLAAPGAEPAKWAGRRLAMSRHLTAWMRLGRITEEQATHALAAMPDDDDRHPYNLLGRWDMAIREDYQHPSSKRVTVANAADYLNNQLGRIAQDESQDWPLFAGQIRKCRRHMESVLATLARPERGAPCPACVENGDKAPRLVRKYGHWCTDDNCREPQHYTDDSGDTWTCGVNREHRWTHADYAKWVETRRATTKAGSA